MSRSDMLFQALREANPAPVQHVDARPSADDMLAMVRHDARPVDTVATRRRGMALAAAGFAAVIVVVGLIGVATSGQEPSTVPTTQPPTTSTTTSTTTLAPTTTLPVVDGTALLDPSVLAVLDAFVAHSMAGDVDGIRGQLAPGVTKTTARDHDPTHFWDLETALYQIEIDAVLNTTLALEECRPLQSGSVTCEAVRSNDLTRIAGVGPQVDTLTFRVESGKITVWLERQGVAATAYQLAAVAPFTAWLADAHPEIPNPHSLDGGVRHWQPRFDIIDQLAELVSEYAVATAADG